MRLRRSASRPASAGATSMVSSFTCPLLGLIFPLKPGSCHDGRMTSSPSTVAFRAARDLLLAYRSDYAAARREFAWPELDEFNWALDWFDVIAAEHPDRPALRIVSDSDGGPDGRTDVSLSYGALAGGSAQGGDRARGP